MMGASSSSSDVSVPLGHTSADAQKRIKQLLILLTPDESSLTRMSLSLLEDIRLHNLGEFVHATILHCVKCLPQKSMVFVGLLAALRVQQTKSVTTVAAGAGATHEEADKFMHAFLDSVSVEIQSASKASRWEELRLLLRFSIGLGLSGLVDIAHIWSLVQKLQLFLHDPFVSSSKRDYLLYTLLALVPFLAEAHDSEPFAEFRASLEALVAARPRTTLTNIASPSASSSSHSSATNEYVNAPFAFDLIDCWASALEPLRTRDAFLQDASEVSVQRASYQCFRTALESVAPLAWHVSDHLQLPTGPTPRLRPVLRLFPRGATASSTTFPLNDLLIGDYVSDLLISFEALHKECTKQLLALPLPLSDEARQVGQFLLIESIFENLLTLPAPNVRAVYYGTIFIDLFKAQPNLMPPLLGAAVNFLFHRLAHLDVEVVERLLDWFTFHLSNFGYVWPWVSWNYVLSQSDSNPQRAFVANALSLCVRLSYWERIQQVVPEEFVALMPHQPHPAFRFSTKNIQNTNGDLNIQQYYQFSIDLMSIIQGKSAANAIVQWLDQNVATALGSEARSEENYTHTCAQMTAQRHDQDTLSTYLFSFSLSLCPHTALSSRSIRLFTPCILECGNKSYSHLIALLDRYKTVFQTLCTTTTKRKPGQPSDDPSVDTPVPSFDVQRLILHSLSEYWQHSVQHIIVLLDHFFTSGVISIQAVIGWVFFASRLPESASHLWRPILHSILRKAIAKLEDEATTIREKPRSMSLTAEKRAADEQALVAVQLEQRDTLAMCVGNFQKLVAEAGDAANKTTREKDRERYEQRQANVVARAKQFVRAVRHNTQQATSASPSQLQGATGQDTLRIRTCSSPLANVWCASLASSSASSAPPVLHGPRSACRAPAGADSADVATRRTRGADPDAAVGDNAMHSWKHVPSQPRYNRSLFDSSNLSAFRS